MWLESLLKRLKLMSRSLTAASTPVDGGSRPYADWFLLNRDPPHPLPPRLPPRPRPPLAFFCGGIPAVAGVGIVGAKLDAGGGVYGFVSLWLRYMLFGAGDGAAHAGGEPHAGVATVGVMAMFSCCCACCPTVVRRAVIS